MQRSLRPRRGSFPDDNIRFRLADNIKQLLLLCCRNLELVQGLLKLLGHHIPLALADIQKSVRLVHRLSGVLAWATADLADQLRNLELEIWWQRTLAARSDGRILV